MKHTSVRNKAPRQDTSRSQHRPVTGPKGVSIAPPAYGIDFVDLNFLSTHSKPTGLQAKLNLGPVSDKYEQEADRVAEQVIRQMEQPGPVQREHGEVDGQEQPTPVTHSGPGLQRSVAPSRDLILGKPEGGLRPRSTPPAITVSRVQPTDNPRFARTLFPGRNHEKPGEQVQKKPLHGPQGGVVQEGVEQQIQAARGSGKPLDKNLRSVMEQGFGANFCDVRIHTGKQADVLNLSLNSRAFTVGKDIFFRRGEYNPGSDGGKQLLAHELTHTVQQSGSGVQREMIQRAIGFEFEFGTWQTNHLDRDMTRLDKGEEIYRGDGYKVEGEDVDADTSAIEVVTKPYSNMKEAVKSVRRAQKWMKKVSEAAAIGEGVVRARRFGGASNIRITPGSNNGKMQASPAIAIDKMPDMFRKANSAQYSRFADAIAFHLNSQDIKQRFLNDADASAELTGLVTLLVDYLCQGAFKNVELSYPKSAFRIMARTSFTKMFKLVPEYDFFRHPDNVDQWVNLILDIASKINPDIGKEITPSRLVQQQVTKRKWWGKKYTKTNWVNIPLVTRTKSLHEIGNEGVLNMALNAIEPLTNDPQGSKYKLNLTRDEWLRSMATEDKLSKAADKRFEGMGAYGDAVDIEVLEDLADRATQRAVAESGIDRSEAEEERRPIQAPLFELRGLGDLFGIDQHVTLDNWDSKVKEVFAIINDVNKKSFRPGGKPTVPADVDNPGGWTRL